MSTPYVRVVDALSGAGGFGWGLEIALKERGLPVEAIAINHDDEAVATHLANITYARHFAGKIEGYDPQHAIPKSWNRGWDIFAAGFPCIHFSPARGGRPVNDQMRMHAWEAVRWHAEMRGRWLVGENVPAWKKWGPLCILPRDHRGRCTDAVEDEAPDPCDKPLAAKAGLTFLAWKRTLEDLGWNIETRVLNAADYGAATDRERLIIIGRRDGGPIPWPEATHAEHPDAVRDLFGYNRLPWRTAAEVIDFSNLGRSMFLGPQNKRAWAVKTLLRAGRGGLKHWGPLGPVAVMALRELGLPVGSEEYAAAAAALGTTVGPFRVAEADVMRWLRPLAIGQNGGAEWRAADAMAFPTIPTGGALEVMQPLLFPYYGKSECSTFEQPMHTVPTHDRFGKLVAVLIPHWNERANQAPRFHSVDAPLPAVTSRGAGNLVQVRLGVGPTGGLPAERLVEIGGHVYVLDIFFRMLTNAELAAATGFPPGYVFVGGDSAVKAQIGNAVCPPLARAVFGAILDADVALRRRVLDFHTYQRERLQLVA